jgi:hypothetical protein
MIGMQWKDLVCLFRPCKGSLSKHIWQFRHCQRHETQDITLLSGEDAKRRRDALGINEQHLRFANLLSGKHEAEARKKQFACVHCLPFGGRNEGDDGDALVMKSLKVEKAMDIHGIRQHMKAK